MSSRSRSPSVSLRRLSSASSLSQSSSSMKNQENLINAYEAEEERIINVLSRKLEKLREEKIDLENALEAESESHVNRLSRELAALRTQQQQAQAQAHANGNGAGANGHGAVNGIVNGGVATAAGTSVVDPSVEVMLGALRRENEQLRNRLSDIERDYIRISRLNEIYREELIDHRNRLGQSVDNLIGLSSADPLSQPNHHRLSSSSSSSSFSSPSTSVQYSYPPAHSNSGNQQAQRQLNGVPIPRPFSQNHRQPLNHLISESTTPLSHSPTSASASSSSVSESPYDPASLTSNLTNLTTPPSSASIHNHMQYYYNPPHSGGGPTGGLGGIGSGMTGGQRNLTYPSVPPPSLSSSFGSPTVSYYMGSAGAREPSLSPVEPLSRRNSNARRGSHDWRVAETGSLRSISSASVSANASANASRRASVERGGRVAETGSLVPRSAGAGPGTTRSRAGSLAQSGQGHSRGQSQNLPATTEVAKEDGDGDGGGLTTGEVDL